MKAQVSMCICVGRLARAFAVCIHKEVEDQILEC